MTIVELTLPPMRDQMAAIEGSPRSDLRAALTVVGIFVMLIIAWAQLAPLDAAATAAGQIVVSGHDQIVAHRDGGVVAEVNVVEGQRVRAGQVLAALAPDDLGAAASALSAQVIGLEAQRARLQAELQGNARIVWPERFAGLAGGDLATAATAMHDQQAQFDADLGDLRAQEAVSTSRAQGLAAQIAGGRGQLQSNQRQQALFDQQLAGIRALAAKGYAPQNTVRSLERSAEEVVSQQDQIRANIAQYRQQIAESALTYRGARSQFAQAAATSLRDTEEQLSAALPKLQAATAQLDRGTLRAETDGVVTGLTVFAPGSVVAPGQQLMEVVPSNPKLTVETRLAPNDLRGVHVGQPAQVRILALGSREDPILHGTLTQLSADSLLDDKTGRSYYTATVTVPEAELKAVDRSEGSSAVIRPGLPVQVMIPLRPRTAFEYLFEPLTQSLWQAFRQR